MELVFGLAGLLFLVLGWLIGKKEQIGLLQSYHRDRVSEENRKRFCTLCGLGVGVIGLGMLATAVLYAVAAQLWSLWGFAAGFLVGLTVLVWAIVKYNR